MRRHASGSGVGAPLPPVLCAMAQAAGPRILLRVQPWPRRTEVGDGREVALPREGRGAEQRVGSASSSRELGAPTGLTAAWRFLVLSSRGPFPTPS